jgi:phosphotransferase system IIB component
MKLKFIKPSEIERNIKATVHKTGKLSFTVEASNKMGLNELKSIGIAINEESDDENLYVVVYDKVDSNGYKIGKAGGYHYVNTKALFDSLKLDYNSENNTIIFDITENMYEGNKIFTFKRRTILRKEIE